MRHHPQQTERVLDCLVDQRAALFSDLELRILKTALKPLTGEFPVALVLWDEIRWAQSNRGDES